MLAFAFMLPLVAALLCLALNRFAPTRWLGMGAAAATLLAALALLAARVQGDLPLALPEWVWAMSDNQPVRLALQFDAASFPLAVLALAGGALGLFSLALTIPAGLRGFGALFAAALLSLLAAVVGMAIQEPLLLPFAWAMAALSGFMAMRASGTTIASGTPRAGLLMGLLGALALLAAMLLAGIAAPAAPIFPIVFACWALAILPALGGPPFHTAIEELAEAPAALAGVLLAIGLPLLGGYTLIRLAAANPLPADWRLGLTLLGLLTLLVCAAAAHGTPRLRSLLGWQFSAQLGLVLVAVAQGGLALAVAAPALLLNAALSTLAGYLAVGVLAYRAGVDDLFALRLPERLLAPMIAFLIAAASAVGLPGTWGLWGRRWLLDALLVAAPWAVGPLLAGSALMALAYVAPLAAFLRPARSPASARFFSSGWFVIATLICPLIAVIPLLLLGVAPQLAWLGWLEAAQPVLAPPAPAPPSLPDVSAQFAYAAAALAIVALPLLAGRGRARAAATDPEMQGGGVLPPEALGQSLRGLAWFGEARGMFEGLWAGLLGLSRLIAGGLAIFERRYYLAGLVIALLIVMLLFI